MDEADVSPFKKLFKYQVTLFALSCNPETIVDSRGEKKEGI